MARQLFPGMHFDRPLTPAGLGELVARRLQAPHPDMPFEVTP
jgi:hypothetical protein